jgi:outer membrane protein assembly factor BamB
MKSYPTLVRWLAAGLTAAAFVIVVAVVPLSPHSADGAKGGSVADEGKAGHGWSMFGGSISRNFVNTFDRNIASDWSVEPGSEKHIKWSADLGSKAYGGPVIAGGKVFVGTNNKKPRNPRDIDPATKQPLDKGIIICFRESDGKFLWQAVHDKLAAGRVNDWPEEGICSTPTVEGNRLYYVSNRCELVCADTEGFLDGKNDGIQDEHYKTPTDADIIWRLDMIKGLNVFPHNLADCSPLVVGDRIFVVTSNGVDEGHINIPCPAAPSFIAVDKKSGKVLWQKNYPTMNLLKPGANLKELVDRGQVLMHGQWSNPVYTEVNGKPQVIFPGGDGWLYGLEPETGDIIWRFDCNPKGSIYQLGTKGTRSDFVATPVVYDNKVYIGVGQDPEHKEGVGHLWCIDVTRRGDVSPVNNDFNAQDPVNKGSALVWHFGGPAPEGSDRNYIFGRTMSSCAVHDGLLYVAELAGYLHCLDAKTGKKYWDHDMGAATWCSPYWVDGKIYIGNDNGELLVFADGKEKKLLTTINMEGKIRATPVAANGVLYVMTENKLYAVK